MIKRFSDLSFSLLTTVLLSTSMMNSQINAVVLSHSKICTVETQASKSYTMRLDFLTESQINDIIQSRIVGLDKLCANTMGCQKRKEIVLQKEARIQLFTDTRIKSVELIKMESGKKTSIAISESSTTENYITVPQQITRENIDSFMLLIST